MSQPYRGLAYHFSKIWILLEITEVIYDRKPSRTKENIGQHRRNRAVVHVILEMFIQIDQIHAGIPSPLPSVTGSNRTRISSSVMIQWCFQMHYTIGIPDKLSHQINILVHGKLREEDLMLLIKFPFHAFVPHISV